MEPEGLVGFGSESQGAHHQTQPTSQLALMTFSRGCTTKPTTSIGPFWLSCWSGHSLNGDLAVVAGLGPSWGD
jgi:hypothetical protein